MDLTALYFQAKCFYDVLNDIFTEKYEGYQNEIQTLEKYWNYLIENRQQNVEYFKTCVGVLPKAGPKETEYFPLNTQPMVFRSDSSDGYVESGNNQWPVYVAGESINGAVGVEVKGQLGILTFCVCVTYEATFRTMSRSSNGEETETIEVLFSRSFSSAPIEINCEELFPHGETDLEKRMIIFPFDLAIVPHVEPSIQPFGDSVKICQIHAIYTRVRIYSEEGLLKSVKTNSTGLWIEPRPERKYTSLKLDGVILKRDFHTGLFGTSGKISCVLKLPQNYFSFEEIIKLTLDVTNESSQDIESVAGSLSLECKWSDRCFIYKTEIVRSPGIASNDQKTIDLDISTGFPALSNWLLPISCSRSSSAEFAYSLNIVLVRKGFRRNIVTRMPVYRISKSQFF